MNSATTSSSRSIDLRLRAQVERLVKALETLPPPSTDADARAFARAAFHTDKAVRQVMGDLKR